HAVRASARIPRGPLRRDVPAIQTRGSSCVRHCHETRRKFCQLMTKESPMVPPRRVKLPWWNRERNGDGFTLPFGNQGNRQVRQNVFAGGFDIVGKFGGNPRGGSLEKS